MRGTAWIVGMISVVHAAGASAPLEITVQLNNFANAPQREVTDAKREAAWVFSKAGIGVRWVDCPASVVCNDDGNPSLFVLSITREDRREEQSESAFGFALVFGRANHAAAIYPRITAQIQGDRHYRAKDLLAMVMVHELAHLLFHSTHHGEGIMKRSWNSVDFQAFTQRKLIFSGRQAQELKGNLVERTNGGSGLASK